MRTWKRQRRTRKGGFLTKALHCRRLKSYFKETDFKHIEKSKIKEYKDTCKNFKWFHNYSMPCAIEKKNMHSPLVDDGMRQAYVNCKASLDDVI
jgi:hypothetical protein